MEHVSVFRATMEDGKPSSGHRHIFKLFGTALWLWDPTWPELVHPHAGAIDTPLPLTPSGTHMMLTSKPDWVDVIDRPEQSMSNFVEPIRAKEVERRARTALEGS